MMNTITDEAVEMAARAMECGWTFNPGDSRLMAAVALEAALPAIREAVGRELVAENARYADIGQRIANMLALCGEPEVCEVSGVVAQVRSLIDGVIALRRRAEIAEGAIEGTPHLASDKCWCGPRQSQYGVWVHNEKEGHN